MLNLSYLKLFAGVFFAAFILSACGGGGGDAAAPAAAAPTITSCADANQHVVDNVCTDYTSGTCSTAGKYWDTSSNCVAVVDSSSCGGNELVVNNQCVAAIDPSTCTSNQLVVNNECVAYTETTCLADSSKYWDTSSNCVAKLTTAVCNNDGYNGVNAATNTCVAYTAAECKQTQGKKFANDKCTDLYVATEAGYYEKTEYYQSGVLESVKAAQAYANIQTLIDADTTNTIKQAGEGQIISIYDYLDPENTLGFGAFGYDSTYAGLVDATNPVFVDGYDGETGATNNVGACEDDTCRASTITQSFNNSYESMAGRRDGTGIHGIAYDAKIKIINYGSINYHNLSYPFSSDLNDPAYIEDLAAYNAAQDAYDTKHINTIKASGGAGIAATINTQAGSTTSENNGTYEQRYVDDGTGNYVLKWFDPNVPSSPDYDNSDATEFYSTPYIPVSDIVYNDAWLEVVDTTIIVSNAGDAGANSVNGLVEVWDNMTDRDNDNYDAVSYMEKNATDVYGSAEAANIASYADAITSTDFAGKWIVAVGVDASNVIHSENNGCGTAKQYCLAVPELESGETVIYNDMAIPLTVYPEYTLAGALAVIRGAYPNLSVAQTVALTLGTADYLDESEGEVDDTTGKYNAVYGHGLLNLDAATSLNADDAEDANIISSSASPIGAIWGDTKLTLSHLFGTELSSVNLGVQDGYGRHFVLDAQNTSRAAVSNSSFDDYMANMLGDASQSQKLGTQTKLNYSNASQTWMDLQYKAGKATTSIAFQDSYKIKPLHDNSASTILRANNIRPASNNIGMMDIDYALNSNLSLSSYAARGEYDTGYKFDELGTDFDVNYKKSHLNIAIGNIREHDQFLGTNTTGAYALNAPTVSRFTDVTYGHDLGGKFNIYANYINYETDVDMLHDQFASIDGLQADQYQIGFTGKDLMSKDDSLNVALITKLGVTDGALNQNTVLGYTADGGYNNVNQSYDLTVDERHQQFEITYQGKLYQNADKISALRENRFFTSIKVDSNLNHVQGASQVEVVSGINIRY